MNFWCWLLGHRWEDIDPLIFRGEVYAYCRRCHGWRKYRHPGAY